MRARHYHHRRSFTDLKRLVALPDLGPYLGDLILRRSIKITALTGGAALFGSISRLFGVDGPDLRQAASMTLTIGLSLTGVGLLLKLSPMFIRRARGIAEASQMNLLEGIRKSDASRHLGQLWDRVARYEQLPDEQREREERERLTHARQDLQEWSRAYGSHTFAQLTQTAVLPIRNPSTREGFIGSALFQLRNPHPNREVCPVVRQILSLYANYLDGAPFHHTDTKLQEEGEFDPTMSLIRQRAYRHWAGPWVSAFTFPVLKARESWIRLPQKVWFPLCVRAIASRTGDAVNVLNRRFHTTEFDALHLLWPGAEEQAARDHGDGARELILELRQRILSAVFGPGIEGAQRMLDRMLLPNAEIATEMRYRFDPDYCEGLLEDQLGKDLTTLDCQSSYRERHLARCQSRAHRLRHFDAFLKTHAPSRWSDPERRLSLRVAFHTYSGLSPRHLRSDRLPEFEARCQAVLARGEQPHRALVYLRSYQTLSLISVEDYRLHLHRLFQT